MSNGTTRKPKHQEILDTLLEELGTGRYREGDQLPTEFALADRFQVSRPTVSRALQELVRLGLVSRRAGHGTFVRPRKAQHGMVLGLLVPELGDSEIFEPICGHIARNIQRFGHVVHWAESNPHGHRRQPADTAAAACRSLVDRGVSGVFLAPFVTPDDVRNPNRTIVQTLSQAGIAIVLLDRDIVPFPDRSEFDLVAVDHLRGQARMTEYLIRTGCRRFDFWIWEHAADTVKLRSAGIARALLNAELPADPEFMQTIDPDDEGQVAALIDERRPDAIMCANDVFAGHLMQTLERLRIRVPDDVSVVGYDDVRYAHLLRVPLTTISQPCEHIGNVAARMMLERIEHPELPPREALLTPGLAIRESTRAMDETERPAV